MALNHELTCIDLFCGCGGLSCGAELAGLEVLAGVDIEKQYISSFQQNFGLDRTMIDDLTNMDPQDLMKRCQLERGELTLLMGGPPCQGFSKNVPRKNRFLQDPRNLLVSRFLSFCEAIMPRLILMENVAEMTNGFDQSYTNEIGERLSALGYSVSYQVLNAADYGIPQRRKRAFFLAARDNTCLNHPMPTHGHGFGLTSYVSVWDAIGDLPSLVHGEGFESCNYLGEPLSDYQVLVRNPAGTVRNHQSRKLQDKQYRRIAALAPGQGLKDLPEDLQVKGGYSGAYGRLTKEMVAPTITRWVFHPGSGRWGHPVDTRLISIREVARLQGFPDSFTFTGSYTQQAGQLGNAVPPLLAKQIIVSMLEQIGLRASFPEARRGQLSLVY